MRSQRKASFLWEAAHAVMAQRQQSGTTHNVYLPVTGNQKTRDRAAAIVEAGERVSTAMASVFGMHLRSAGIEASSAISRRTCQRCNALVVPGMGSTRTAGNLRKSNNFKTVNSFRVLRSSAVSAVGVGKPSSKSRRQRVTRTTCGACSYRHDVRLNESQHWRKEVERLRQQQLQVLASERADVVAAAAAVLTERQETIIPSNLEKTPLALLSGSSQHTASLPVRHREPPQQRQQQQNAARNEKTRGRQRKKKGASLQQLLRTSANASSSAQAPALGLADFLQQL